MRRAILAAIVIVAICAFLGLRWIRPIVRWPLLLLSGVSLFVLVATLVIPYPVPVRNQLLMVFRRGLNGGRYLEIFGVETAKVVSRS